jgi:threonine/homoserine/homoserine lactone efflux protein
MDIPDSGLLVFLGFVILVSLSGVMMPGPVLAATITKGFKDKYAGIWIALAHGVVEFPLIAGLYWGLDTFFQDEGVMIIIGLGGGAMLVFMGYGMVRHQIHQNEEKDGLPYHPFWVGIITSLSNPYFFLWWATVGILLITTAGGFGAWAVALFAVTHWSCDLAWDAFVGYASFRSKYFWNPRTQSAVLQVCGIILVAFGAYFMLSPILA